MYYHKMCGKSKDLRNLNQLRRMKGDYPFMCGSFKTVHAAHLMDLNLLPVAPDIAKLKRTA